MTDEHEGGSNEDAPAKPGSWNVPGAPALKTQVGAASFSGDPPRSAKTTEPGTRSFRAEMTPPAANAGSGSQGSEDRSQETRDEESGATAAGMRKVADAPPAEGPPIRWGRDDELLVERPQPAKAARKFSIGRLLRRLAIALVVLGLLGALAAVGGVVGIFWFYGRGVEGVDVAAIRNYRPKQVTRITARDGTVIGELYSERRTLISMQEIPKHVENAFLAAEDADFYHHEGMDYMGMARALVSNLQAGTIKQGASTITQQVVKNFLLSPERTLARKVQELILARRLEQALSKEEILQLYLNEIYFGHGRYGVEEASQFYFGKSVRDISIGQAALLAAMPKSPSKASPYKDRERAKNRQVYVLKEMARHGFATPRDAKEAIDAPLDVLETPRERVAVDEAQEFVDAASQLLVERYGEERLETLGATVTTTVDLSLQASARASVRAGLVALDRRQGYGHKVKPIPEKRQKKVLEKVKGPLKVGETYPVVIRERATVPALPADAFVAAVGEHQVIVRVPEGSRYDDPEVSTDEQFPAGGVTMVQITKLPATELAEAPAETDGEPAPAEEATPVGFARGVIGSGPEAAVVLADVETGEILAMIGGYDHRRGDFNRAVAAARQPGSSFKPFVYGAALDSEKFTAATLVSDSPEIYEKWRPTNFEVDVYRGDIRVREALTHSVNTVAIKLADAVGLPAVHAFARAAGIESPLADNLSLALGVSEVRPIELLGGYLTLARGGSRVPVTLIKKIEAPGEVTWEPGTKPERALRQEVVFILTSMMTSVVAEGTGTKAQALGRPVAAKTGTSSDLRDAWFAGFTPAHVAVAWVGFDVPKRLGKSETGGRAALPIWLELMKAAEADTPPGSFVPPPSVLVRTIDRKTGLLAPPMIEQADGTQLPPPPESLLEEYFISGTEPVERAEPAALPAGDALLDLYGTGETGDDPSGGEAPTGEDPGTEPTEPVADSAGLPSLLDE